MTYNPNRPNAGESPGVFPAQANTNFTRLKTLINADHVFNDTAAATDGVHRQMTMVARSTPGSLPAGTNAIAYTKLDSAGRAQLRYYNGATDVAISPPVIVAAVNFNGTGAIGNQTIRSQLNVTSVNKTATGTYTVTFTSALANNNYIVQLTGMRNASGDISNGLVAGDATYGNSVSTASVKIQFNGGSSTLQDVLMGNVIIMSVPA
jgi:hypothetical protein